MSKYKKGQSGSAKTDEEAYKVALGIQKSAQTKEQTKLVAQGIKKGIELYKKQQKAKSREIDKNRKLANKQKVLSTDSLMSEETVVYKQHWLPWLLLVLSWIGFGIFITLPKIILNH